MQRRTIIGILYLLGAALGFACMNLFVSLSGELPVMQKVFFRNLFAAGILFFLLLFSRGRFRIRRGCGRWLFLRAIVGFLGVVFNFYAIDRLDSISDASILNKLSPFFAIFFSAVLLKERPAPSELLFVAVAFAGAVCVVRPSAGIDLLPALSGVLSGAAAGFAYTCVRVLGVKGERAAMTIFFFSAFSTLAALPFFLFGYVPMSGKQWLFLVLAGLSAAAGQFFITAAYRAAPAREIAVFDYAQVPIAAVLGFLFLGQVPEPLSYAGYALIIGAAGGRCLLAVRKSRKQTKHRRK